VPSELDQQVCSTGYFVLRPQPKLDYRFVFYFLQSDDFIGRMEALQKGASYPAVTDGDVRSQPIPHPPLPEQRRIVAILDEAFAAIATAKANAERNLENAREVFDRSVDAVFAKLQGQLPGKPLSQVVESISTGPFGSLLHKSDYEEGGIPLVNPINIVGDKIVPDPQKAVGKATAKRLARYVLEKGDVVTARRGEIGRCAAVATEHAGWLCGTGSFFIRPGTGLDSQFLTHLLRSCPYRSQLERLSGRATMPSIGNDDLAGLVVHIPGLEQQQHIESMLAGLSVETQRLESIYQRKLAALDEMKKSLLQQAFSGQLEPCHERSRDPR
jgi:type I restriction enzyme S subunit